MGFGVRVFHQWLGNDCIQRATYKRQCNTAKDDEYNLPRRATFTTRATNDDDGGKAKRLQYYEITWRSGMSVAEDQQV